MPVAKISSTAKHPELCFLLVRRQLEEHATGVELPTQDLGDLRLRAFLNTLLEREYVEAAQGLSVRYQWLGKHIEDQGDNQ